MSSIRNLLLALVIGCVLVIPGVLSAQEESPAFSDDSELMDDGEAAFVITPNMMVEMMGYISTNGVLVRSEPNNDASVLARQQRGDKIIMLEEMDDWYKIRLYNGRVGYVSKRYISLPSNLRNENKTNTRMEKKVYIDIQNLVASFNDMVKESIYAQRHKVVPYMELVDARQRRNRVMVTVLFGAVDLQNNIVPSQRENPLASQMKQFVEIMFLKMMIAEADEYQIIIRQPNFYRGRATGGSTTYTTIVLGGEESKNLGTQLQDGRIWEHVSSDVPVNQLFAQYPN